MLTDFVSGYVGGLAGVIIGHPFDTIKVYLQTNKCNLGAIGTCKTIIKQEGIKGLYKGMTSPLFGTAFLCSILFGVNGVCTKTMPENVRTTIEGQFLAGSVAGCAQSLVTCPMEMVKIRMQLKNINLKNTNIKKNTLARQTIEILREKGGYRSLFKGMTITLLRDAPGFGVCFAVNQFLINCYKNSAIAGGFAGVISWIPSYPFDVIKTRVQSCVNPSIDTRFIPFTKSLIKNEGIGILTKGMGIQLLRAFPMDASMFCAAAMTTLALGRQSTFFV